ncbi:MAG: relaxase domain-containing protein [Verrucomicrobiales bacterium]|nr:relaxase domain-containing protein [Verrucomicrobiales bacterium]
MITARPQKNLVTAREYFRQHLAQGNYHSEDRTVAGHWFGLGAERLGLKPGAVVTEAEFGRLCENQHPATGEKLTVRKRQKDHRVFYDFTVSAPKSVSVMAFVAGDQRIIAAHDEACQAALTQMEKVAATRVRKGGQDGERVTGEVVAASFRHDTSRALDPQLHTHFVVFNATWDPVENRWKALQTSRMYDQMALYTEVYRSELAHRLQALGYELHSGEHAFEIAGVSPGILHRFSKRRRAILDAQEKMSGKLGHPLSNNGRGTLAHTTRQAKDRTLDPQAVLDLQRAQLTAEELSTLTALIPNRNRPTPSASIQPVAPRAVVSAAEAVDYARDHHFERQSVVETHDLLKTALAYSRGSVTLDMLQAELAQRSDFLRTDDQVTTRTAFHEEQRLISLINLGMGRCRPLNPRFVGDLKLSAEQRTALRTILGAPDRVVGLRGGAGTGKTRLLLEVVRGIEERQPVIVLAPTTAGVEALRKAGLTQTATVQRFLADPSFREQAKDHVLLVDEAGLLSTKDMLALVEQVQHGGRMILSGDTRQHTSVRAGDALRLLEERSSLRMAGVHTIRRQVDLDYREAIAEFAQGNGPGGLARLARLGAVVENPEPERYALLADDYLTSVRAKKSALVVSPTWHEIEAVTHEIRKRLKGHGLLGKTDTTLTVHRSLKWTEAQKRDLRNYREGHILSFHRPTRDFARGESAAVVSAGTDALQVRKGNGSVVKVTRKQAGAFDVAQKQSLAIAAGERLLLQGNRKEAGLFNGQVVTVKKVRRNGRITLTDGRTIPADFRDFTHGYCVTSHASQGRTVDHVYVAVDSAGWRATHRNQFYVSASRGRERVRVYTDDIEFLHDAVGRSGARLSASELMDSKRAAESVKPTQRLTQRQRMAA